MHTPVARLCALLVASGVVSCLPYASSAQAPNAWINELHYDDVGADSAEFVEVVIDKSFTDLERIAVVLYNGAPTQLKVYATHRLSTFQAGAEQQDFVVYAKLIGGLQNGPDGIALCFDANDDDDFEVLVASGTSAQFVTYEGSFTPVDGCAAGIAGADIGIEETTSSPEGSSLGLVGSGTSYDDFSWASFEAGSVGDVNAGQTLGALAVHLAVFDAVVDGTHTVLRWSTASEDHHEGFGVERRTSGQFVDIGFVPAAGLGGRGADYVFVDTESGRTVDGYRLRMINRDGSFNFSPIIHPASNRVGSSAIAALHPNPTSEGATLAWSPWRSGSARISLHDILGREVAVLFDGHAEMGSTLYLPVDVSGLAAGSYLVRAHAFGEVEVRRLMVAR